ncbi:MAG: His/Gly/Thr/Pro-type tRNA ligase C-terminal domain-containing protein, partial [Nitriliruptoraceae bacterium]
AFPLWLAPVQVRVVPVADEFGDHSEEVAGRLRAVGLHVEVDHSTDTLGAKIRDAQTSKIPVTLVIGGEERDAGTVSVREYGGEQRRGVPLDELVDELVERVATRASGH